MSPRLYHGFKSIPWVLLYIMYPILYHESKSIPWVQFYTSSPSLYHVSKFIRLVRHGHYGFYEVKAIVKAIGEISSNLYRASVCDMKKGTFLLISLSQVLYYTLQTTWYGITKNVLGKLPDHWWLHINTFNFEGCHTLTHIFQILIIIIFFQHN